MCVCVGMVSFYYLRMRSHAGAWEQVSCIFLFSDLQYLYATFSDESANMPSILRW